VVERAYRNSTDEPAARVAKEVLLTRVEPSETVTVAPVKAPPEPLTHSKISPSQGSGGRVTASEAEAAVETRVPVAVVKTKVPEVKAVVVRPVALRSWEDGAKIDGPPGPP